MSIESDKVASYDVFISYSRTDSSSFVDRLDQDLRKHNIKTYVDRRRIEGGQIWLDELERAIKSSQIVLVVLSPEAIGSQYVSMEYRYALSHGKTVIPLDYQTVDPPIDLHSLQRIDFKQSYKNGLRDLINTIRNVTNIVTPTLPLPLQTESATFSPQSVMPAPATTYPVDISRRKVVTGIGVAALVLAFAGYEGIDHLIGHSQIRASATTKSPLSQTPTATSNSSKGWRPAKSSLIVPRNAFFGITYFSSPFGEHLVLVEGGGDLSTGGFLADSEIFDPKQEMWTKIGSLPYPYGRSGHTNTLLPNAGKVLIAGGYTPPPAYPPGFLDAALLYDPETKSWTSTHVMNQKRTVHTAVQLGNDRVLVVGGWAGNTDPVNSALKSCEIYDYNNGDSSWTPVDDMLIGRQSPGCVVLPDGRVLVMGGYHDHNHIGLVQTELYDPHAQLGQQWSRKADMHVGRWGFGTLWIPSIGKVLVAGGVTSGTKPSGTEPNKFTQTAELYDVGQDQWTMTKNMAYERGALDGYSNAILLIKNGTVLVVGGDRIGTSEVFVPNLSNPTASSWEPYDKSRDHIGQSIGRSVWLEDTGQVLFVTSDYSFIYTP